MNRIDRLTAILVQLQSRPLVRASDIAVRYSVSLRTVYRDMRSLMEAGVPICGDAGVGYSLIEGYRLPPLIFTQEEAIAFLTAEKFIEQLTDRQTGNHFNSGMDKIRALLRNVGRRDLTEIGERIEVYRNRRLPDAKHPNLIQSILESIVRCLSVEMSYFTPSRDEVSDRLVEPVGVSYVYPHWYMTAYCHTRGEYRNFRLDRIERLTLSDIPFSRQHPSLSDIVRSHSDQCMTRVVLHTSKEGALKMGDRKYSYGLIEENQVADSPDLVEQTYMAYSIESIARWVLANIDTTTVIEPPQVKTMISNLLSHCKI